MGQGVGDLIKIPPILGDVALAYLVWSMTRELGGSERAARIGAVIVLVNPVTWFDSVLWGQVDSVGVVFLLLGAPRAVARPAGALGGPRDRRSPDQAAARHPDPDHRHRRHPSRVLAAWRLWARRRPAAPRLDLRARGTRPRADPCGDDRRCRTADGDRGLDPIRIELPGADRPDLQDRRRLPVPVRQRLQSVGAPDPDDGGRGEQSIALSRSWICDSTITPSPQVNSGSAIG